MHLIRIQKLYKVTPQHHGWIADREPDPPGARWVTFSDWHWSTSGAQVAAVLHASQGVQECCLHRAEQRDLRVSSGTAAGGVSIGPQ